MSKINKFFVSFLLIIGIVCLVIGTAFAVDFMAEHPEEFACDLNRPVVAANRPFVDPVVEPPLSDFVISPDDVALNSPYARSDYSGDLDYVPAGFYNLSFSRQSSSGSYVINLDSDSGVDKFSLVAINSVDEFISPVSLFSLLYTDYSSAVITVDGASITLELFDDIGGEFSITGFFTSFDIRLHGVYNILTSTPSFVHLSVYNFDFTAVTAPIFSTLVSGLRALGVNVGRAFSTMANAIFINADGTGLSTFGILICVFASISLALSLTRWVLNFCSSWGKRNR